MKTQMHKRGAFLSPFPSFGRINQFLKVPFPIRAFQSKEGR